MSLAHPYNFVVPLELDGGTTLASFMNTYWL